MFVFPYDTTACSGHITANIIKAIKTSEVTEGLSTHIENAGRDPILAVELMGRNIQLITTKNEEVPPFAHPLLVEGMYGKKLVVDSRAFTRKDKMGVVTISSESEYKFNIVRALLTDHMANHSPRDLLTLGTFPMLIYARWMSENITKRMGLNPSDQMRLMVICAFFYLSLFREDPTFTEDDLNKNVQMIAKATFIPIESCFEIADQITPMYTVRDFVEQINTIIGSSRLEKFSVGLLYTILMNTWFGNNSREMVNVAIEHPPTWLAMVYSAINDRGIRNCILSKVVQANDKKDAGKVFTYNLINLIA